MDGLFVELHIINLLMENQSFLSKGYEDHFGLNVNK